MSFDRPCVICGRLAQPGTNRCAEHAGPIPTSCRICGARTCGEHFCAEHAPTEAERLEREPWRAAKGRCERCGSRVGKGWHCDHVVPLADGGTNAIDNLRVLCRPCHNEKTRADRAARRSR
jgi:5-methylcytosine-specific restriction protein A